MKNKILSPEDLGKKIRKLRKEKGKSQNDLGKYLKRSHAAISDIERGKTKLTYENLREIAVFFDMTISEFIEETPQVIHQENYRVSPLTSPEKRKELTKALNEVKEIISFSPSPSSNMSLPANLTPSGSPSAPKSSVVNTNIGQARIGGKRNK